jgi:hypothetical protein
MGNDEQRLTCGNFLKRGITFVAPQESADLRSKAPQNLNREIGNVSNVVCCPRVDLGWSLTRHRPV